LPSRSQAQKLRDSEDKAITILRNVGNYLPKDTD